jgi:hypothetical protein
MRRKRSTELERTAYHEAGHAVAAVLLCCGLKDRGVTIVPYVRVDKDDMGKVKETQAVGGCSIADGVMDVREVCVALLAGHEAQNIFRKGSSHWLGGALDDFAQVEVLLTKEVTADPQLIQKYTKEYAAEAKALLLTHWRAVERLAAALLERQTVSGPEAEELVWKAAWTA